MSPVPPKKILVIKWRAMGDTALLSASLQALRDAMPSAQIDVSVTTAWAPLIEGHPGVRRIIPFERRTSRRARLRALMRVGFELRREAYDAVLGFHASPSSAALALATGSKKRAVHFHGHTARNRYSTLEIPGKGILKPILERDLDVVRALGPSIPVGQYWPKVYLSTTEKALAATYIQKRGLRGPVLGLGLGASRATKAWDLSRYFEVAQRWNQETNGSTLAVVSPVEAALASDFAALVARLPEAERPLMQITADLDVRRLASVTSQMSLFLGNDSGPRHVAAATGVPTLTLFGPEDPFEWHPYPRDRHPALFIPDLACRADAMPGYPAWCGISVCEVEKHKCMTQISVESVLAQLRTLHRLSGEIRS